MRGGKQILGLWGHLYHNAPPFVLTASGYGTVNEIAKSPFIRGRSRIARVQPTHRVTCVWEVSVGGIKCTPAGDAPAYSIRLSRQQGHDIPQDVMTSLHQQYAHALERMDGFYQKALQHLVPGMVLDALEGKRVSWKQTFEAEVSDIIESLADIVEKAFSNSENHTTYQKHLVFQGKQLGMLSLSNTGVHTNISIAEDYLVLPDILKAVEKWCQAAPYLAGI